ncbi:hypothetical protein GCM10010398_24800 [Streptomyces fimbriatus]
MTPVDLPHHRTARTVRWRGRGEGRGGGAALPRPGILARTASVTARDDGAGARHGPAGATSATPGRGPAGVGTGSRTAGRPWCRTRTRNRMRTGATRAAGRPPAREDHPENSLTGTGPCRRGSLRRAADRATVPGPGGQRPSHASDS